MSNFRTGQNNAHPQKRSMILSTLIVVMLVNLLIQIWLLYTALNNALNGNKEVAYSTFIASLVLFLASSIWLHLLPKNVK
jgi:predicted membrane channel-forming protein YqfA (hemolysin III family)